MYCLVVLYLVPAPRISLRPSGYLQGVVGEMQDIICSVTITSGVDPDSVELTWTLDDITITVDDRVTIIQNNVTENLFSFTHTTVIRFAYIMEGDEGNYSCNVLVGDMMESSSTTLENLRSMHVKITINIHVHFIYLQYPVLL